ncbi:MAG TPA: DUF4870 domain-containing protein [Paludibacter sp.]|nr:DUF4870 domain-containing protein [Paludibacter sp.]
MDYDKFKSLLELKKNGDITEEEFEREKAKLMNEDPVKNQTNTQKPLFGLEENNYLMLMHLSQFAGWIVPFLGYAMPVIMWFLNKDTNANVDRHGKNIINFTISFLIYFGISTILVFLLIGIPILIALGIMGMVFIIMATIKAANGEEWKYPLTIEFIK